MKPQPDLWHDLAAAFEAAASPRLPLDEWAAKYRRVAPPSPFAGRWDHRNAPMSLEPMRALSSDDVRAVVVITPSQILKTELAVNAACWASDYGDDCLFFEPDQPLLKKKYLRTGCGRH